MPLTATGTVLTKAAEVAMGTVTLKSTGARSRSGVVVAGDTAVATLDETGAFSVPFEQDCVVTISFQLTNADNPGDIIVQLPDHEGEVNVFDLAPLTELPEEEPLVEYLTAGTADARYVLDERVGREARVGIISDPTLPTGGREGLVPGIAPLDNKGIIPARHLIDGALGFGGGRVVGYDRDTGEIAPVLVDTHFKGYTGSQPTEPGEPLDYYMNNAVPTDGSPFIREWICRGGTDYMPVIVNRASGTSEPTTPTPPPPGAITETFSVDQATGWGPDQTWIFARGSGSVSGGYGYMAGGFTVSTIAVLGTPLQSATHAIRLQWVAQDDTADRSVGVMTRVSEDGLSGWLFEVNVANRRFTFQKIIDGTGVYSSGFQVLSAQPNLPITMELRSRAGSVHECYINDELLATFNKADPAIDSNTRVAVWQYNGNSEVPVDNVSARDLT